MKGLGNGQGLGGGGELETKDLIFNSEVDAYTSYLEGGGVQGERKKKREFLPKPLRS